MPWWPRRVEASGGAKHEAGCGSVADVPARVSVPEPRVSEAISASTQPVRTVGATKVAAAKAVVAKNGAGAQAPDTVTTARLTGSLDRLDIRYLTAGDGGVLAMWERHALLIALEGPQDEILVMRARPHATVPPDWTDRAYRVLNEWNHTRRFHKAYLGDPTERDQLPIYAEMQVPLGSGVHDALLDELIDCASAVAVSFVDWLYDEGALL